MSGRLVHVAMSRFVEDRVGEHNGVKSKSSNENAAALCCSGVFRVTSWLKRGHADGFYV